MTMPKSWKLIAGLSVVGLAIMLVCITSCRSGATTTPPQQQTVKPIHPTPVVEPGESFTILAAPDPAKEALFNPMPLRVGTVGSTTYHRPLCKVAQSQLKQYGVTNRVNFFSIAEIEVSGRTPNTCCIPEIFTVPNAADFADKDVYRMQRLAHEIPIIPAGKTVCNWEGHTLAVVPTANCQNGVITTDQGVAVDIEMIYFNAIAAGIGDVNGDGDINEDDLPYLCACFGKSTSNCKNAFDYNNDGIVNQSDVLDFKDAFQPKCLPPLGGNSAWINVNYPNATHLFVRPIPLRVSMMGSTRYHLPNCKAWLSSVKTYGLAETCEFYSRDDIVKSQRTPDTAGPPNGCDATLQSWEH